MTGDDEYERGHAAGEIAARLADHDRHFRSINGSLGDVARELHGLGLAVQRLGDQAVSRDATVITTAAALKDAEAVRRDQAESAWSPWQKLLAILGGLAAVAAVVGLVFVIAARP